MKDNRQLDGFPRFDPSTGNVNAVFYDANIGASQAGYTIVPSVSLKSAVSIAAGFVATSVALLQF